jgi:dinuclear metal center YbgI/SA1388 family protein
MHLKKNELGHYLEQLLSPSQFEDYAPNGVQVDGVESIKQIAFAVSATQDSLAKAIDWGAQALIVHHGIFWKHQGSRPVTGAWGERVKRCIKADLNLFAYHLPLDAHPEVGNAASLARELELINLLPFAPYKKQHLGIKGTFADPLTARELRLRLEHLLGHQVILASHDENRPIQSLGIVTGGANNEWAMALQDGLDAYLTGEISEYNWHDAIEAQVHYFAGGHHATERFGIQSLMERIKRDFPKLEVRFFDSMNPA